MFGDRSQLPRAGPGSPGPQRSVALCLRLAGCPVAVSQLSQRHTGPWAPPGSPARTLPAPSCLRHLRTREGTTEGMDPYSSNVNRASGLEPSPNGPPQLGLPRGNDPKSLWPAKSCGPLSWQCPRSWQLPGMMSPTTCATAGCHQWGPRRGRPQHRQGKVWFGQALALGAPGGSTGRGGCPTTRSVPSQKATAAQDFHQRHMAIHSKSPGIPDPNRAGSPGWAPCPEALRMGTRRAASAAVAGLHQATSWPHRP